jgi:hypothetical protein
MQAITGVLTGRRANWAVRVFWLIVVAVAGPSVAELGPGRPAHRGQATGGLGDDRTEPPWHPVSAELGTESSPPRPQAKHENPHASA